MMNISDCKRRWLSRIRRTASMGMLAGALSCSSGPVALGTGGDGSTGAGDGALGDSGSRSDGGEGGCCPAGYDAYGCTFPDGGAGTACHDRAKGCASSLTCGVGCDAVSTTCTGAGDADGGAEAGADDAGSVDAGPGGDGATDAGGSGDTGSALTWWNTCGDPVCRAPDDAGSDAGPEDDSGAPCPAIGSACASPGQTCGTHNSAIHCGAIEICAATDPVRGTFSCPMSSRAFKDDIHYVSPVELEMLHEEALHIRLATYNYKAQYEDSTARHLGFIVEDDPKSPAVDRPYDRVDLYGYVSMVVATMQVQEKEIAGLRHELEETRRAVCAEIPAAPRRR